MKAIFETGGKQYYVEENQEIYVEKLETEENKEIVFDKVLMINGVFGNPYILNAKVTAKILKHGKQKKIIVFHYIQKNNFHKKQGHRQPYTKLQITKIEG